jgi:hypothetical protein
MDTIVAERDQARAEAGRISAALKLVMACVPAPQFVHEITAMDAAKQALAVRK